ncbi:hypothetical protein PV02_10100 [Methanolobus chelungpuianus]|uniref:Uncharacterized protein n=1 Tax=Methanolobus chelungpuianus TaxID=502115 RepID=A0AAE3KY61_9EURY|nr:hypothetical protein [Methanolobus chelungpuianus]
MRLYPLLVIGVFFYHNLSMLLFTLILLLNDFLSIKEINIQRGKKVIDEFYQSNYAVRSSKALLQEF